MRRILFLALTLLLVSGVATAKKQKKLTDYAIGFYNLENLFDTIHDEVKNDF